jgi:hypothetical protein
MAALTSRPCRSARMCNHNLCRPYRPMICRGMFLLTNDMMRSIRNGRTTSAGREERRAFAALAPTAGRWPPRGWAEQSVARQQAHELSSLARQARAAARRWNRSPKPGRPGMKPPRRTAPSAGRRRRTAPPSPRNRSAAAAPRARAGRRHHPGGPGTSSWPPAGGKPATRLTRTATTLCTGAKAKLCEKPRPVAAPVRQEPLPSRRAQLQVRLADLDLNPRASGRLSACLDQSDDGDR